MSTDDHEGLREPTEKVSFTVSVPQLLRHLTEDQSEVAVELDGQADVSGALEGFLTLYPGCRERLFDEDGILRKHVNVFVDDEDARFLEQGFESPLPTGSSISILPAVSGG